MAIIELTSCDGCGNVILPGDIASITTKGILTEDGSVEAVEGSRFVHFCEGCSQAVAEDLSVFAEELLARMVEEAVA